MNKEKLKELLNTISNIIGLNSMFDFEDNTYFFKRVSEDDKWTTGKENWKQHKDSIYQLLKMDKNTYEELERYELYVKETKTRCGGYYTDYYYTYERYIVNKVVTHIPEEVIVKPAHDDIKYVRDEEQLLYW